MKVEEIKYFCDVCKEKIEQKNENFNIIPDKLTYKYGNGVELVLDHICPKCSEKIDNYISELLIKSKL